MNRIELEIAQRRKLNLGYDKQPFGMPLSLFDEVVNGQGVFDFKKQIQPNGQASKQKERQSE